MAQPMLYAEEFYCNHYEGIKYVFTDARNAPADTITLREERFDDLIDKLLKLYEHKIPDIEKDRAHGKIFVEGKTVYFPRVLDVKELRSFSETLANKLANQK